MGHSIFFYNSGYSLENKKSWITSKSKDHTLSNVFHLFFKLLDIWLLIVENEAIADLFINGTNTTTANLPEEVLFGEIQFFQEKIIQPGRTFTFVLPSEVTLVLELFNDLIQANILVAQGVTTNGLVGQLNGNIMDDFLRPDNTTLPINSTMRDIYYEFGEKC